MCFYHLYILKTLSILVLLIALANSLIASAKALIAFDMINVPTEIT